MEKVSDWIARETCGYEVDDCTRFDVAQGLYWYCSDWHGGQSSDLYSILSARLQYTPGHSESEPEPDSLAAWIYSALERGELDAADVCEWVNATREVCDA